MTMKPEPGTYKLTRDLPAPYGADKRTKHDWRYAPMLAGARLYHVTHFDGRIEIWRAGGYQHQTISAGHYPEVVSALERVEETPSLLISREHNGYGADAILDLLHADGVINIEQVKEAYQRVYDEEK